MAPSLMPVRARWLTIRVGAPSLSVSSCHCHCHCHCGSWSRVACFFPRRVAECRCQRRRQLYPVNQVSSCRGRAILQFVCDASLFLLVCWRKTPGGVELCSRVLLQLMWHGTCSWVPPHRVLEAVAQNMTRQPEMPRTMPGPCWTNR